jgi:hypothetical protein
MILEQISSEYSLPTRLGVSVSQHLNLCSLKIARDSIVFRRSLLEKGLPSQSIINLACHLFKLQWIPSFREPVVWPV